MKRYTAMLAALMLTLAGAWAGEQTVDISGGTAPLYGTLTMPEGDAPVPAVLIIAGSGPTDRDGNSKLGIRAAPYKLLAEALAAEGIASLRFDKRGVGESAPAMTAEADVRFETYIDDAVAWTQFLAAQKRVKCVVIVGHSEGSLIGMVAATKTKTCGYVSLAGLGRSADQAIADQLANAPHMPEALLTQARAAIAALKAGTLVADPPPALAALFRPSVQPYLISWFAYDPAKIVAEITQPVLIVQGENDIQVPMSEAALLAKAAPKARLVTLLGMNHILKIAPAERAANVATYADPALPLAPGLVQAIVDFVHAASK